MTPADIGDLETVCDFILRWYNIDGDYAGDPIADESKIPKAASVLNRKLGGLWKDGEHPVKSQAEDHRSQMGLFQIQNEIVDPNKFHERDGVIGLIWEDQGVTNFGFQKENPEQTLVSGSWVDDIHGSNDWRKISDCYEDILVYFLMTNFGFLAASPRDDLTNGETQPKATSKLLWQKVVHQAPRQVWVSPNEKVLHFRPYGFTVTKPD